MELSTQENQLPGISASLSEREYILNQLQESERAQSVRQKKERSVVLRENGKKNLKICRILSNLVGILK